MPADVYIPTLTHATERDVDLLLVEELYASHDFVCWMAARAGISRRIQTWDVKHSKRRTQSRREIDIFVEISHSDGTRSTLLIENKLDTSEQPDQAESYREELAALAAGDDFAAMMLVCPEAYFARKNEFASKFDVAVTYEDIRDYFLEQEAECGADTILRFQLRAELFDQAIHKHRRGYTSIPDRAVGDFNANYVALLAQIAPEIVPGSSMLKPANPRESTSMIFDQEKSLSRLPRQVRPRRFAHELGRGSEARANYVAVTFAGWGAALPAISDRLQSDTTEIGAAFDAQRPTKTRPNPGLVMKLATAPVDNQASFEAQSELVSDGIRRAAFLRRWLIENADILKDWESLVDQQNG